MFIESTGMVCSVGLSAESACAAMRAGIAKFDELPYYQTNGNVILGSSIPGLEADFENKKRIIEMLSLAISECLSKESLESTETVPLLVCLSEPIRPSTSAELVQAIIHETEIKLGLRFHPQLSRVIPKGHTSGFEALRLVHEFFRNSDVDSCILCGADSYINANSLLWLEQHWRLKTEDNSDGVIPGEAGAAVLLRHNVGSSSVRVLSLGFAHENANILSAEPLLGLGLAEAAQIALQETGLQLHEIDFRISDVTGESYGFKEQALAFSRLMRVRREDFPIWHCADSIGDTGAVAGLCQLIIAREAFLKNYAHGNRAICFTSAVAGDRAVAVLQRF